MTNYIFLPFASPKSDRLYCGLVLGVLLYGFTGFACLGMVADGC
jgi:hypothetical protein